MRERPFGCGDPKSKIFLNEQAVGFGHVWRQVVAWEEMQVLGFGNIAGRFTADEDRQQLRG